MNKHQKGPTSVLVNDPIMEETSARVYSSLDAKISNQEAEIYRKSGFLISVLTKQCLFLSCLAFSFVL